MQIANYTNNANEGYNTGGYGYQIWMTKDGFILSGLGSQMAYCFPDKNFMFVCQGDTMCMGDTSASILYFLVQEYLYKNLQDFELCEDLIASQKLSKLIESLDVSDIKRGENISDFEKNINGVKFKLKTNNMSWQWVRLDFDKDGGTFTYENTRGEKSLKFRRNEYVDQKFPETYDYDVQVHAPSGRGLRCLASGSWLEEKKFLLRVHFIDTNIGNMYVTLSYKGDEVGVAVRRFTEFYLKDYGDWDEYTSGEKET